MLLVIKWLQLLQKSPPNKNSVEEREATCAGCPFGSLASDKAFSGNQRGTLPSLAGNSCVTCHMLVLASVPGEGKGISGSDSEMFLMGLCKNGAQCRETGIGTWGEREWVNSELY